MSMKTPSVPSEITRLVTFMLKVGASEASILRAFESAARSGNEAAGLGYMLGRTAIATARMPRNGSV